MLSGENPFYYDGMDTMELFNAICHENYCEFSEVGKIPSDLAMDIREKLDRLRLPLEAESPIVLRYDPSLDPIMKLSLSGEMSLTNLRVLGEKE